MTNAAAVTPASLCLTGVRTPHEAEMIMQMISDDLERQHVSFGVPLSDRALAGTQSAKRCIDPKDLQTIAEMCQTRIVYTHLAAPLAWEIGAILEHTPPGCGILFQSSIIRHWPDRASMERIKDAGINERMLRLSGNDVRDERVLSTTCDLVSTYNGSITGVVVDVGVSILEGDGMHLAIETVNKVQNKLPGLHVSLADVSMHSILNVRAQSTLPLVANAGLHGPGNEFLLERVRAMLLTLLVSF